MARRSEAEPGLMPSVLDRLIDPDSGGTAWRRGYGPERNMSEALLPYYNLELDFIGRLAQEFAKQYPNAAGRLLLDRRGDPHVERLIQSFALLTARVHHKLDDEFPELTDALLGVLYPHYLAPIPSMAIVQFELDYGRAQLPNGFQIAKHSRLHTQPVGDLPCKFQTGYPVTLWPVE